MRAHLHRDGSHTMNSMPLLSRKPDASRTVGLLIILAIILLLTVVRYFHVIDWQAR